MPKLIKKICTVCKEEFPTYLKFYTRCKGCWIKKYVKTNKHTFLPGKCYIK